MLSFTGALGRRQVSVLIALIGTVTSSLGAQQAATIPIRPLGRIVAVSDKPLQSISQIRVLRDGRVLVNDRAAHRVILLDSTLARFTTVLDTTVGPTKKAYGPGRVGGALIPYASDSTLFVDQSSISFLVIAPTGRIARVMAVPRPADIPWLITSTSNVGFDASGRLLYAMPPVTGSATYSPSGAVTGFAPSPDSVPIRRVDMVTRKADTLALLRITPTTGVARTDANGSFSSVCLRTPMPITDDWAILPDGSVALIRGTEYRVTWINADGSRTSSPKVQHDWGPRLMEAAKTALLDSLKRADSISIALAARADSAAKADVARGRASGGRRPPTGDPCGWGGAQLPASNAPPAQYVDASDLPDYRPGFVPGTARADANSNIWVGAVLKTPHDGGPVYDVINRKGVLVDRVQIPGGCTIVGFGTGVVYLTSREGTGVTLARARLR